MCIDLQSSALPTRGSRIRPKMSEHYVGLHPIHRRPADKEKPTRFARSSNVHLGGTVTDTSTLHPRVPSEEDQTHSHLLPRTLSARLV